MKPFLVISDLHYHSWSAFSETRPDGVNSRLELLLEATREAAYALRDRGGNVIFNAGDTFHKRGSVEPAVLNPVMDLYRELVEDGFEVYAVPGNHDMTSNDSLRVGNAVTALESVGVKVAHKPMIVHLSEGHKVVLFPWYSKITDLLESMQDLREALVEDLIEHDAEPFLDAIIHAPIDGVLPHLPAHGLDASALFSTGFNRVFSGHYHNHKHMGDEVYSVGSLTHQSWGDIGSLSGYLIVDGDKVEHHETKHPVFVELTGDETDAQAAAKCKGNYVRVRAEIEKDSELKEIRDGVKALGAAGVTVIPVRKTTVTRAGAVPTTSGGVSIETSVKAFLDKKGATPEAHTMALDVLSAARAA